MKRKSFTLLAGLVFLAGPWMPAVESKTTMTSIPITLVIAPIDFPGPGKSDPGTITLSAVLAVGKKADSLPDKMFHFKWTTFDSVSLRLFGSDGKEKAGRTIVLPITPHPPLDISFRLGPGESRNFGSWKLEKILSESVYYHLKVPIQPGVLIHHENLQPGDYTFQLEMEFKKGGGNSPMPETPVSYPIEWFSGILISEDWKIRLPN